MKLKILVFLAAVFLLVTAARAQKLMCVSEPEMQGEEEVSACLARGETFAVIDQNNMVRILTPEEAELSMAFNPKAFCVRAFGVKHVGKAPKIPPLPVTREAP